MRSTSLFTSTCCRHGRLTSTHALSLRKMFQVLHRLSTAQLIAQGGEFTTGHYQVLASHKDRREELETMTSVSACDAGADKDGSMTLWSVCVVMCSHLITSTPSATPLPTMKRKVACLKYSHVEVVIHLLFEKARGSRDDFSYALALCCALVFPFLQCLIIFAACTIFTCRLAPPSGDVRLWALQHARRVGQERRFFCQGVLLISPLQMGLVHADGAITYAHAHMISKHTYVYEIPQGAHVYLSFCMNKHTCTCAVSTRMHDNACELLPFSRVFF